jgi:hypothetical protein
MLHYTATQCSEKFNHIPKATSLSAHIKSTESPNIRKIVDNNINGNVHVAKINNKIIVP